jgi:hypothetical protein
MENSKAVYENNFCLFCESYETHKSTTLNTQSNFNIKAVLACESLIKQFDSNIICVTKSGVG